MTGWTAMDRGGYGGGGVGSNGGRSFPFGPWGVALLTAGLGALAGLLIPMAWIEEVSWQLYLDELIAAARPPLGVTARLAAVAALALGLGLIGWLTATLLGVRASVGNVSDWFASLRGARVDDEPDAPTLRSADRHPDAPARRPFSASRDVLVDDEPRVAAAWADDEVEADELLLDSHFDENVVAVEADEESRAARWDELELVDTADEVLAEPVAAQADPTMISAELAVADVAMPAADPAPLDLSIAKLDELIARLEAGLSRREALAMPVAASDERLIEAGILPAADAAPVVARGVEAASNEPSFPQDPALAAALATLRRMNRTS